MKTIQIIIGYILWTLLIMLVIFQIDRLWLQIILLAALATAGWIGYAVITSKTMPDNYDEPKYYKK